MLTLFFERVINVMHVIVVASVGQLEEAKMYVERSVMSRIYTQAMFPNGDADMMRDQLVNHLCCLLLFST
jgi:hypothetical protein